MKGGEFLDHLNDCQLLKDAAAWSYSLSVRIGSGETTLEEV
jgi:hypothetical protein